MELLNALMLDNQIIFSFHDNEELIDRYDAAFPGTEILSAQTPMGIHESTPFKVKTQQIPISLWPSSEDFIAQPIAVIDMIIMRHIEGVLFKNSNIKTIYLYSFIVRPIAWQKDQRTGIHGKMHTVLQSASFE